MLLQSTKRLHSITTTSRSGGFSLVETLTVVSILGIVIILAVPTFGAQVSKFILHSEATKIKMYLEHSAAYALASQSSVAISATKTMLSATHQDGYELSAHVVRNGVELELPRGNETTILFHPTISASPTTLTLKRARASCSVIVSLRGRIRIAC